MPFTRVATSVMFVLLVSALDSQAQESRGPSCTKIPGSAALLAPGKVVLLGELHGTNESPSFVASLACNAVVAGLDVVSRTRTHVCHSTQRQSVPRIERRSRRPHASAHSVRLAARLPGRP